MGCALCQNNIPALHVFGGCRELGMSNHTGAAPSVPGRLRLPSPCITVLLFPASSLQFRWVLLPSCHGLAWLDAGCPPKPLYHSPSSTGQGRKNNDKKLVGQDKDREITQLLPSWAKQT